MTAAPLPAPLPCPFCGAEMGVPVGTITGRWEHPWNNCYLAGDIVLPPEQAAWNHRAPEAQAWRAIETAPRDGMRKLLSGPYANWPEGRWIAVGVFQPYRGWVDDADKEMEQDGPTHWQPLPAPPGATPAAPPAREAALVEALRFYGDRANWREHKLNEIPTPSACEWDGGLRARAALAEAEGRT